MKSSTVKLCQSQRKTKYTMQNENRKLFVTMFNEMKDVRQEAMFMY